MKKILIGTLFIIFGIAKLMLAFSLSPNPSFLVSIGAFLLAASGAINIGTGWIIAKVIRIERR